MLSLHNGLGNADLPRFSILNPYKSGSRMGLRQECQIRLMLERCPSLLVNLSVSTKKYLQTRSDLFSCLCMLADLDTSCKLQSTTSPKCVVKSDAWVQIPSYRM